MWSYSFWVLIYCEKFLRATFLKKCNVMKSFSFFSKKIFHCLYIHQDELSRLQSQGRIAQLSAEDLQMRLTDAYREREELSRKLREAEEALGNKVLSLSLSLSNYNIIVNKPWPYLKKTIYFVFRNFFLFQYLVMCRIRPMRGPEKLVRLCRDKWHSCRSR